VGFAFGETTDPVDETAADADDDAPLVAGDVS
jgi:hypothetical protein